MIERFILGVIFALIIAWISSLSAHAEVKYYSANEEVMQKFDEKYTLNERKLDVEKQKIGVVMIKEFLKRTRFHTNMNIHITFTTHKVNGLYGNYIYHNKEHFIFLTDDTNIFKTFVHELGHAIRQEYYSIKRLKNRHRNKTTVEVEELFAEDFTKEVLGMSRPKITLIVYLISQSL